MTAKIISRLSVIVLALVISGCSTFSFIFERLDWFTLWRLDKMFDLSEEQEAQLKPDLIELQEWMREEGFPETINKLESLIKHWDAGETESAYHHLITSMAHLNKAYLNAMKEGVVKFSLRLNEKNAQQYRTYSDEQQEEWFESLQSIDALVEHETERLEDWFGHLNDEQISLIENRLSISENELNIRINNHLKWREAYLRAALNRDENLIRSWLDDLSIFWTPEYTLLKQYNDQKRQDLMFALFPTLSEKQKKHAREKVQDWIEKLNDVLSS